MYGLEIQSPSPPSFVETRLTTTPLHLSTRPWDCWIWWTNPPQDMATRGKFSDFSRPPLHRLNTAECFQQPTRRTSLHMILWKQPAVNGRSWQCRPPTVEKNQSHTLVLRYCHHHRIRKLLWYRYDEKWTKK